MRRRYVDNNGGGVGRGGGGVCTRTRSIRFQRWRRRRRRWLLRSRPAKAPNEMSRVAVPLRSLDSSVSCINKYTYIRAIPLLRHRLLPPPGPFCRCCVHPHPYPPRKRHRRPTHTFTRFHRCCRPQTHLINAVYDVWIHLHVKNKRGFFSPVPYTYVHPRPRHPHHTAVLEISTQLQDVV